jgi:hypothetical protein
MIEEKIKRIGIVRIIKTDVVKKKVVKDYTIKNRITNDALDEMLKIYYDPTVDMSINMVAIGDDNTPVSDSSTRLYNEVFRTPVLSRIRTGVGQVVSRAIIKSNEPTAYSGNITFYEMGFFCSPSAYYYENSGILLSRIVVNETKTATEQLEIQRTDIFERG